MLDHGGARCREPRPGASQGTDRVPCRPEAVGRENDPETNDSTDRILVTHPPFDNAWSVTESTTIPRLSALWQTKVTRRSRRVGLALGLLVVVSGAHLARFGTGAARFAAGALLLSTMALMLALNLRARRRFSTTEGVIRTVVVPTDAALGARALRAETLLRHAEHDSSVGSVDLAKLHLGRVLTRISFDAVSRAAQRSAAKRAWTGLMLLAAAGAGILVEPMRILEGLDVLAARGGIAPVPINWLSMTQVTATPPAYLRASERRISTTLPSALPRGTSVTVRGVPERSGRRIVLTDGKREVPFVDDGSMNRVAHWTLTESTQLRIAARFGEVLVFEPAGLELVAIPDEAPQIVLEGAPRSVQLKDLSRLELRFVAKDDHGLRQIDLVLRSGGREDRRVLMRLDGQSKREQGAHALDPQDAFLRRMFLPVVATIEGRDNDVVSSAKWGTSAPVTIVPPTVGEPERTRLAVLERARDRLVDLLEHQMATEREGARLTAKDRRERQKTERDLRRQAVRGLREVGSEGQVPGGVPGGLEAFLRGQASGLERAGSDPRPRTEDALLAVDVGMRGLATIDARTVAKRLGDVAEEIAEGARVARDAEQRRLGIQRSDLALQLLDDGVLNLVKLGTLGADLGDVASGESRRIRRARSTKNFLEIELSARHLAARLRRPTPSFSFKGGGGVESGQGTAQPNLGEPSQADRQFDQLMHELGQLAAEHAQGIKEVEQTLAEAESGLDSAELRREATRRAALLREALGGLPRAFAQEGSARAAAALGREHVASMAQGLERLALGDAVDSGRRGAVKLEEAARLAKDSSRSANWLDERALGEVTREVGDQLAWAEKQLNRLKQRVRERAAPEVASASERESEFARQAGNLAGRGTHSEARLPEELIDSLERAESAMQDAARELAQGRGERGLEMQREAQRLLERSNSGPTSAREEEAANRSSGTKEHGNSNDLSTSGSVPAADTVRRAEEFRKRVLDGLSGQRRGRLGPAVERYAEELLQ